MKGILTVVALAAALAVGPAKGDIFNFTVHLSGDQEVPPGSGDPDGSGIAHLAIDDSTDPPTIDWFIEVSGISESITGDHIHQAPQGVNGSVVVNFGGQLSGSGLQDSDLTGVLSDPTGYYVNVHTDEFPAGAIRGQIPEPGTLALLALAGLGFIRRR
jgi:hypothetical protein